MSVSSVKTEKANHNLITSPSESPQVRAVATIRKVIQQSVVFSPALLRESNCMQLGLKATSSKTNSEENCWEAKLTSVASSISADNTSNEKEGTP